MKFWKSGIYSSIFIVMFIYPNILQAQSEKPISFHEAIAIAKMNNNGIRAAQYNIDFHRNLKATSTELGRTSATLMYGQYNTYFNDNNFALSQEIPFPGLMVRQSQYFKAAIEGAEINKQVTENQLLYQVKSAYFSLLADIAKQKLLLKQDSIFVVFLKAAALRLKTGESNILEKATAESQLFEIRSLEAQNDADIIIFKTQLQTFLNTDQSVSADTVLYKKELNLPDDSSVIARNPALQYFRQQIKIAEAEKNIQKARLLPDITLGYFNQTLYGTTNYKDASVISGSTTRFQGVTMGISFPLWIKPQLARIKAYEANNKSARSTFELYQKNLQGQYAQAFQEYEKYRSSLSFYEKNALPTSEIIIESALKNYKSGNIGYVEFSQGLNRALEIQTSYLAAVRQYNQSVINIEFLVGSDK